MEEKVKMAYIGKLDCGCVLGTVVDDPNHKKDTIKAVSEFMKDGLAIERVTVEWVRKNFGYCELHKREREKNPELFD